jgi:hypothetical protein
LTGKDTAPAGKRRREDRTPADPAPHIWDPLNPKKYSDDFCKWAAEQHEITGHTYDTLARLAGHGLTGHKVATAARRHERRPVSRPDLVPADLPVPAPLPDGKEDWPALKQWAVRMRQRNPRLSVRLISAASGFRMSEAPIKSALRERPPSLLSDAAAATLRRVVVPRRELAVEPPPVPLRTRGPRSSLTLSARKWLVRQRDRGATRQEIAKAIKPAVATSTVSTALKRELGDWFNSLDHALGRTWSIGDRFSYPGPDGSRITLVAAKAYVPGEPLKPGDFVHLIDVDVTAPWKEAPADEDSATGNSSSGSSPENREAGPGAA